MEIENERVMVFIDIRNVTGVMKHFDIRGKVDFVHLTETVAEGRNVMAAYVFDGEDLSYDKRFHDSLRFEGFSVITRNSYNPDENRQKEVDSSMVCGIVSNAYKDNYDTAIIVSGDRDFLPAVELVMSLGKKVEIAGFTMTMSNILSESGDVYHDLDGVELFYDFVTVEQEIVCNKAAEIAA